MAVKPENIVAFCSVLYGECELIKTSVGVYRKWLPNGQLITYWRGQLAKDWYGELYESDESWCFSAGQVVWLDTAYFTKAVFETNT